jgi:tRNA(fMet)-specific endonuclease VapC
MVALPSTAQQPAIVLLDTNILIIYARAGEPSQRLEGQLGLQQGLVQALVSVISVGESLAFATKSNRGAARQKTLTELVRTKLVPVDINRPEILAAYADIYNFTHRVVQPAHPMGQNDVWIAATAHVLDCEFVTTDKDFDHLHAVKLRRRWIDPTSLKPGAA